MLVCCLLFVFGLELVGFWFAYCGFRFVCCCCLLFDLGLMILMFAACLVIDCCVFVGFVFVLTICGWFLLILVLLVTFVCWAAFFWFVDYGVWVGIVEFSWVLFVFYLSRVFSEFSSIWWLAWVDCLVRCFLGFSVFTVWVVLRFGLWCDFGGVR